ncbi:MAG: biotin/lipoyl-containing protein [Terracidiphilus sp.]
MKLQITIDGRAYAVDVELLEDEESPETPSLAPPSRSPYQAAHSSAGAYPQNPGGSWSSDGKVCQSPVMGQAIKVNIQPGQAVEAGALILVLEAMKMETLVTAPHSGTVKAVHVKAGDSVKLNQVLVEFV